MRALAAAALCMAVPAAANAQGLPEFLDAVSGGAALGVAQSAAKIAASMEEELGLVLALSSERVESGDTVKLTVTAENPRITETAVSFTLDTPQRLALSGEAAWEAVLPPATADERGEIVPSVTTFERTLALRAGGESEQVKITCEMSMGPRFYRAQQALDLCVPDVSVSAEMQGGVNGRFEPGDAFTWRIAVSNAGMAAQDVALTLVKPEGVEPQGEWPEGFALAGDRLTGTICAEAAQAGEASRAVIELPMRICADALEGDEDATRLLSGVLYANGERVPLPRMQVCSPKISAQLIAEEASLEAGETTTLRVLVINEGLAPAQMELSCVLPEGLEWQEERAEATPGEATLLPGGNDGAGPDGVPALADADDVQTLAVREDNALVFSWQMEAASEGEAGVTAATKVFELPVRAAKAQEDLKEQLIGATIAYRVDGGDMRFGEPVAMRLYTPGFLGLTREDWSGVFWAAVLMVITVSCLYGAVRAGGDKEDYYCCE